MADLNALIAQGYQFQPLPDPFVQYGKRQQLEQGEQANQLNQMKLQEAQAAAVERNALRQLNPTSPDYETQLFRLNPTLGIAYRKEAAAAAASKATQERQTVDTAVARKGMLSQAFRDISSRPSDANITAHLEDVKESSYFTANEVSRVEKLSQILLAMPFADRGPFLASQGATANDLSTAATATRGQDIGAATATRGQDIGAATATRGQDIGAATATRGQDIGAATATRGQDIGAATATRGQDIGAATAREGQAVQIRGQDIGATTAREGQAVTARGQDIGAATATRGQDIGAATATRGQDIGATTAREGQAVTARGQDIGAATTIRGQDLVLSPAQLAQKMQLAGAGATRVQTNVNAYTPASEEAQRDFIKSSRATYDTLKNAPGTLKNIEEAKKLIPSAKGFMGPGGESLLDAASFLNNRLGTSINTKGITDASELRSRLFQGIIENLRKLDANPTENQQNAMRVALGNIGTDPNALPAVLDSFADTVRSKVEMHNAEVSGAMARGVKFPYDPTVKLPSFTPPPPSGASLIPGSIPAAAGGGATVTLPDGRIKTFPNADAANKFKKAAGL